MLSIENSLKISHFCTDFTSLEKKKDSFSCIGTYKSGIITNIVMVTSLAFSFNVKVIFLLMELIHKSIILHFKKWKRYPTSLKCTGIHDLLKSVQDFLLCCDYCHNLRLSLVTDVAFIFELHNTSTKQGLTKAADFPWEYMYTPCNLSLLCGWSLDLTPVLILYMLTR